MSDQKQLIECIAGGASTSIGGTTYHFERDQYGRFVASVPNIRHRSCLLSVEHYRAVPDVPVAPPEQTAPPSTEPSETAPGLGDGGTQAEPEQPEQPEQTEQTETQPEPPAPEPELNQPDVDTQQASRRRK